MSQPFWGKDGHLGLLISLKNTNLITCFPLIFVEFCSAVADKKSKMYPPIRGRGSHLGFQINLNNANLVDDVEYLPPVKFSLNSIQLLKVKHQKCFSQSEARADILVIWSIVIVLQWSVNKYMTITLNFDLLIDKTTSVFWLHPLSKYEVFRLKAFWVIGLQRSVDRWTKSDYYRASTSSIVGHNYLQCMYMYI